MLRVFFGSSMGKEELKNHLKHFVEERLKLKKAIENAMEKSDGLMENLQSNDARTTDMDKLCIDFLFRRARMSTDTILLWAEQCLAELEQLD